MYNGTGCELHKYREHCAQRPRWSHVWVSISRTCLLASPLSLGALTAHLGIPVEKAEVEKKGRGEFPCFAAGCQALLAYPRAQPFFFLFCFHLHHGWTWRVLCLVKSVIRGKTNTVCYQLYVESKKNETNEYNTSDLQM